MNTYIPLSNMRKLIEMLSEKVLSKFYEPFNFISIIF